MLIPFAKRQGHPRLAKWLDDVRDYTTPLHWACFARDKQRVLRLLRADGIAAATTASALAVARSSEYPVNAPVCERTRPVLY